MGVKLNIKETGTILAFVSLIDNRQVSDEAIMAWHELLKDLEFEDARQAVTNHFKDSNEYLRPVHIIQGAKRVKMERKKTIYE